VFKKKKEQHICYLSSERKIYNSFFQRRAKKQKLENKKFVEFFFIPKISSFEKKRRESKTTYIRKELNYCVFLFFGSFKTF